MRAGVTTLLAGLALAGCGDRRSFDERYSDTSAQLANQARAIDANLSSDNLAGPDDANAATPPPR